MFSLKGFILFLRHPSSLENIDIFSLKSFLGLVWKSLLILFAIDILFGLVVSSPLKYLNLFPFQKEITFNFYTVIKFSLLLPIIEELVFRLPLRISRNNLTISLSILFFVCLSKINLYLASSLSLCLFLILYILFKKGSIVIDKLSSVTSRYFVFAFYAQAIIFGMLHLTNYILDLRYFYLFPFFIISYIVAGCFLGYIRVRYCYGIYLCTTTHILLNSIYCLILS